jgi:hypothetical protein
MVDIFRIVLLNRTQIAIITGDATISFSVENHCLHSAAAVIADVQCHQ